MSVYLGNCLDVMHKIDPGGVDAVICDLPYGTTSNEWDTPLPLDAMWAHLARILKPHAAVVLFGVQPFSSDLVASNRKGYRHRWVWDKRQAGNFAVAKHMPLTVDEDILVFSAHGEGVNYYPQMQTREMRTKGGKQSGKNGRGFGGLNNVSYRSDQYYPTSILRFASVPRQQRKHPSQKPVDLLAYLVRTYTNAGDTVLDMTMGSGTTGVACVKTGRNFIGIEKDAEYFSVAEQSIAEARMQLPLWEATP